MNDFWKAMLALIPRSWRTPDGAASREAILKFALLVAISLFAGGELMTAMEMRILLEILGAAMFTTAFIAGARLLLESFEFQMRGAWLKGVPVTHSVPWWSSWLGIFVVCAVLVVSLIKVLA